MRASRIPLRHDQTAAALAEFAVVFPVVITVIFGSMDLLYAFYQWNAAAKAVEMGARIAAVSDPVAFGLNNLSNQAVLGGLAPGATMPYFQVTCGAGSCSCVGFCAGIPANSFDPAAMNRIVFGRGRTSCAEATSYYVSGMCDLVPSITAANVVVTYTQTGLGYAGRPGGPLPTITVSLQNMYFHFFFLNSLLGGRVAMPSMSTTITAEALCSGGGACGS
jgi:Flp pilus assembly protein TadG